MALSSPPPRLFSSLEPRAPSLLNVVASPVYVSERGEERMLVYTREEEGGVYTRVGILLYTRVGILLYTRVG